MGFTNGYNDDDFEDFRRYEEYQRRKDEAVVRGVGNFFYKLVMYTLIWFFTSISIGLIVNALFQMEDSTGFVIGMFLGFFIFKVQYIKFYPFRSFLTAFFVFWIFMLIKS